MVVLLRPSRLLYLHNAVDKEPEITYSLEASLLVLLVGNNRYLNFYYQFVLVRFENVK